MSPSDEARAAREHLKLTQQQLAHLLGVHQLTVSKWERGVSVPSPWQQALLATFHRARPEDGREAARLLALYGVPPALALLLAAGLGEGSGVLMRRAPGRAHA